MKIKSGERVGIKVTHTHLSDNTSQHGLLCEIERLNRDPGVHGVLVQVCMLIMVLKRIFYFDYFQITHASLHWITRCLFKVLRRLTRM